MFEIGRSTAGEEPRHKWRGFSAWFGKYPEMGSKGELEKEVFKALIKLREES